MKEIIAMIRLNKVNRTKEALADAGFPSFTCRKVLGRGKKQVDFTLVQDYLADAGQLSGSQGEHLSENTRLIPKRVMTLIVNDDEVDRVVDVLISVNSTGNPGDGKIFQLPVSESYRIRDGVSDIEAF